MNSPHISNHTFFVEPSLVEVPLDLREEFGIVDDNVVWAEVDFNRIPITAEIPVLEQFVPITLSANFAMQSKTDWLTDGATVLQFDKQLVGESGGLDFAVLPAGVGVGELGRSANVNSDRRLNVVYGDGLNSVLLESLNVRRDLNSTPDTPGDVPLINPINR